MTDDDAPVRNATWGVVVSPLQGGRVFDYALTLAALLPMDRPPLD